MNSSPLHQKFDELGATFMEHQGWNIPDHFGSVEAEWKTVRTHLGILDLTYRGKISVKGKDRASFLHNMLSNDIKSLLPGSCCYATLLTPKGKIISDMNVLASEDFFLLELDEANVTKVMERLASFIITEDIEMKDVSNAYVILSLQGPDSEGFLKKRLQGEESFAVRNDRTGEIGYDLWIPREEAEILWDKIQDFEKINPIGLSAYNTLRIEAGIPWFGFDLDENTIPNEANLERAISWTKGCYPGQEVVARIKYRGGTQRILSGLVIEGDVIPQKGDKIFKEEYVVGIITSATFSFQTSSPVALAYLRSMVATADHEVQIHHEGHILKSRVQILPFTKTRK